MTGANDDPLDAPIQTWWAAVLSGKPAASHPAHAGVRARLSHGTLLLSGEVTSEAGREEVLREAHLACASTVQEFDDRIAVRAVNVENAGILSQTVFSIFENRAEAERAAEVLRRLSTVHTDSLSVLSEADSAALRAAPEAYRDEVAQALAAGRGVLIATVDETEVLALREVLDQDTSSLNTVVTPPEVTDLDAGNGAGA